MTKMMKKQDKEKSEFSFAIAATTKTTIQVRLVWILKVLRFGNKAFIKTGEDNYELFFDFGERQLDVDGFAV